MATRQFWELVQAGSTPVIPTKEFIKRNMFKDFLISFCFIYDL